MAFNFFPVTCFSFPLISCSLLFQSAYFCSHTYCSFSGFLPWMFRPPTSDLFLSYSKHTIGPVCFSMRTSFSQVLGIATFCFHHHSLQNISYPPVICSTVHGFFRSMFLNFQVFGDFFFPQASYCCLFLI